MPKTTITGPQQTDRSIAETLWNYRAEALWGLAVTVLLFACVNPMIVSGLFLAAATTTAACWAYRKIADGAEREKKSWRRHQRPISAQKRPLNAAWKGPRHTRHGAATPRSSGTFELRGPAVSPYRRDRAESSCDYRPCCVHTPAAR